MLDHKKNNLNFVRSQKNNLIILYTNIFTYIMNNDTKTNIQYATAIVTLISGIVMCFLSFFLNKYVVHDSALWYFGETMSFAGGIFGIGLYVNYKVKNAEQRLSSKIDNKISKVDDL